MHATKINSLVWGFSIYLFKIDFAALQGKLVYIMTSLLAWLPFSKENYLKAYSI